MREPVTIERLAAAPLILYDAHYGWSDPTRRQLQERAQRAGVQLEPVIEIEDMDAALELAASGLGDTIAPKAALEHRPSFRRLGRASFAEPLYDDFAFITRRGAPGHPGGTRLPRAGRAPPGRVRRRRPLRRRRRRGRLISASMIVASTGGCRPRQAAR